MNKLKPEDVMKALEAWLYDFKGTATQFCTLCDAITLLREKDEEIEHCRMLFKAVKLGKTKLEDENEMLKAEIERLKTREKVLTQMLDDGYNEWEDYVRAEAITEFAEKLIGRFNVCDKAMYSQTTVHDVIARVAKEMRDQNERDNA